MSYYGKGSASQILTDQAAPNMSKWASGAVGATISSFSAYLNASVSNVTGDGTAYDIILNSTIFNVGSNFNTTTGLFTAPVNGTYLFCATCAIGNIGAQTTGRYFIDIKNGASGVETLEFTQSSPTATQNINNNFAISGSFICQLTAGYTVGIALTCSGSTKTISVTGSGSITSTPYCRLSGTLLA